MNKILSLFCFALLPFMAVAQDDFVVRHGGCLPDVEPTAADGTLLAPAKRGLPAIINQWDPNRVYHQLVILVSYAGDSVEFSREDPKAAYDAIFNQPGYNERKGPGCMADYFREQSGGMFNVQFDVYGPYKVSQKAQPYEKPTASTKNYGRTALMEATNMLLQEHPDIDFSQYDWNGNHSVNQVIYVCAGYAGNVSADIAYGYIWPNTSTFTTITTPDGYKISDYTASAELWPNNASCGIGTICHEYTHSLGLPDVYPTSSSAGFSVLDEWDLMDGGNFTNYGWCPPNYTPLEKMLLGWITPVELTEPSTITNLQPSTEGGDIYRIKHTDNEWLLLENRQQRKWDAGAPGHGLVIYHVNYEASRWAGNTVNNVAGKPYYCLVHADGLDYDQWYDLLTSRMPTTLYQNSERMNSRLLSTAPYPWQTDSTVTVNDSLTDSSVPASLMYNANAAGNTLLGMPITDIQQAADGTVSFDFMGGGTLLSVREVASPSVRQPVAVYDLNGRQQQSLSGRKGIYLIRQADGTIRKVLK